MVNVYTVAFEPWHYHDLVNSGKLIAPITSIAPDSQLKWLVENAVCYTMCADTGKEVKIIGVVFICEFAPGNGQVNMIVTNDIKEFPVLKPLVRMWKKLTNQMFDIGYHRLQCEVVTTFKEGKRLVEYMGYDSEGISRGFYEKGVDVERFAIVRD